MLDSLIIDLAGVSFLEQAPGVAAHAVYGHTLFGVMWDRSRSGLVPRAGTQVVLAEAEAKVEALDEVVKKANADTSPELSLEDAKEQLTAVTEKVETAMKEVRAAASEKYLQVDRASALGCHKSLDDRSRLTD